MEALARLGSTSQPRGFARGSLSISRDSVTCQTTALETGVDLVSSDTAMLQIQTSFSFLEQRMNRYDKTFQATAYLLIKRD